MEINSLDDVRLELVKVLTEKGLTPPNRIAVLKAVQSIIDNQPKDKPEIEKYQDQLEALSDDALATELRAALASIEQLIAGERGEATDD